MPCRFQREFWTDRLLIRVPVCGPGTLTARRSLMHLLNQ